jgi:cell division protein FtsL
VSLPARSLPEPRSPNPAVRSARRPVARPAPTTPHRRRARRGSSPAFWFLSAALVAALVFAVVGLNALVVNTTYRMTEVQERARVLLEEHEQLDVEVARLSSPSRIAEWAEVVGMVVPAAGNSVILRVPGHVDPDSRDGAARELGTGEEGAE